MTLSFDSKQVGAVVGAVLLANHVLGVWSLSCAVPRPNAAQGGPSHHCDGGPLLRHQTDSVGQLRRW